MLVTLLRPTGGHARVAGYDVATQPAQVRRRIGVALQEAALDPLMTGSELIELQATLHGIAPRSVRARGADLIGRVGLSGAADRRVGTYSGGMRRRLDLAMALIHEPEVLFLDEPTTGPGPDLAAHAVGRGPPPARRGHDGLPDDAVPRGGRPARRPHRDHRRRQDRRRGHAGGAQGGGRPPAPGPRARRRLGPRPRPRASSRASATAARRPRAATCRSRWSAARPTSRRSCARSTTPASRSPSSSSSSRRSTTSSSTRPASTSKAPTSCPARRRNPSPGPCEAGRRRAGAANARQRPAPAAVPRPARRLPDAVPRDQRRRARRDARARGLPRRSTASSTTSSPRRSCSRCCIGGVTSGIATALDIEGGFFDRLVASPTPRVGDRARAACSPAASSRRRRSSTSSSSASRSARRSRAACSACCACSSIGIDRRHGLLRARRAHRAALQERVDRAGDLPARLRRALHLVGVLPARAAVVARRRRRAVQPAVVHRGGPAPADRVLQRARADARGARPRRSCSRPVRSACRSWRCTEGCGEA